MIDRDCCCSIQMGACDVPVKSPLKSVLEDIIARDNDSILTLRYIIKRMSDLDDDLPDPTYVGDENIYSFVEACDNRSRAINERIKTIKYQMFGRE